VDALAPSPRRHAQSASTNRSTVADNARPYTEPHSHLSNCRQATHSLCRLLPETAPEIPRACRCGSLPTVYLTVQNRSGRARSHETRATGDRYSAPNATRRHRDHGAAPRSDRVLNSEHIRVFLHSILRLSDSDGEREDSREPVERIHGGWYNVWNDLKATATTRTHHSLGILPNRT